MWRFGDSLIEKITKVLLLLFFILLFVFLILAMVEFFNIVDFNGKEVIDDSGVAIEHAERWSVFWNSFNLWLERVWSMTKELVKTSFWILLPATILSIAEIWSSKGNDE